MPHANWIPEAHCAMAQSLAVLGDAWDLLIVRDLLRGRRRFDELVGELGISRKVLTERLRKLEEHGLLTRRPYQDGPVRHEYVLTPKGLGLTPVLVALQDWGDRWIFGDGAAYGLGDREPTDRLHSLVGSRVPEVSLPATTGEMLDVVDSGAAATVLFGYPMTVRGTAPDGWIATPGATGCTLENRLFRDRYPSFVKKNASVRGVSTQRADEQRAFSQAQEVPFPLLSDADLRLSAALRLPTFRAAEVARLRRFIVVIGPDRTVTSALFPITDVPAAVEWALDQCS